MNSVMPGWEFDLICLGVIAMFAVIYFTYRPKG